MAILSQPAFGPRTALGYITGGLLLDVWTAVYYFVFLGGNIISNTTRFWLLGLFLTGLVFIFLGAFLGPIGRAARKAELPPDEAIQAEANIQATAAANPPPVVQPNAAVPPVGTVAPAVPANGVVPNAPPIQPVQPVVPRA